MYYSSPPLRCQAPGLALLQGSVRSEEFFVFPRPTGGGTQIIISVVWTIPFCGGSLQSVLKCGIIKAPPASRGAHKGRCHIKGGWPLFPKGGGSLSRRLLEGRWRVYGSKAVIFYSLYLDCFSSNHLHSPKSVLAARLDPERLTVKF